MGYFLPLVYPSLWATLEYEEMVLEALEKQLEKELEWVRKRLEELRRGRPAPPGGASAPTSP